MVKDFSWNIIPWNALLFEKTLKKLSILDNENYGFIVNTCHDTATSAETRVCFPVIFSRLWWPIEPTFSQVRYFIYVVIHEVSALDNTVYRKGPMALIQIWCFFTKAIKTIPPSYNQGWSLPWCPLKCSNGNEQFPHPRDALYNLRENIHVLALFPFGKTKHQVCLHYNVNVHEIHCTCHVCKHCTWCTWALYMFI